MLSEIKIHASLRHRHIVQFELFMEDHENVYLILEICVNKVCARASDEGQERLRV